MWGSIKLYIDEKIGKEEDENENYDVDKLSAEMLYAIGQAISSAWLVSVAVFFMTCKKEYVRTFVSTATTSTYVKECWDW
jgi:hypothetical protein